MPANRPITILCVSSYEKGQEFMRTCKRLGCTVLLLTVEKLRGADWPREAIDEMFFMPDELPLQDLLHAVSYAARSRQIDRIDSSHGCYPRRNNGTNQGLKWGRNSHLAPR